MNSTDSRGLDMVIDVGKPVNMTGGLEFSGLTYTVIKKMKDINGAWVNQEVDLLHDITGYAPKGCITAVMGPSGAGKSTFLDGLAGRIASGSLVGRVALDGADISPSLIKRTSAYIMQDDRLFPMLTVYETLMFAADFRLGPIPRAEKRQRVESLIEQLGLSSARNTYIGDEGTRGVSGGERRRVSIGVDIIHGPSLLFLDEPTSGLDSTSAHSVIEKGQLMYQGPPKDVTFHLDRMDRKVPKGENAIEYFIDVVQEYDQSELGVEVLAEFALTGVKPSQLAAHKEMSASSMNSLPPAALPPKRNSRRQASEGHDDRSSKRLPLQALKDGDFDHSVRSTWNTSRSWTASQSMTYTPTRKYADQRVLARRSPSPAGYYTYSSEILQGTPTPHSSDYTVNENDYMTHSSLHPGTVSTYQHLGPKFANSFVSETWILMRRNFISIRRTPELFMSRLLVLTVMGIMMATLFWHPKDNVQGITNRLSFFIFTVCLFFFSSNDAVPAFIQERFIFIRETSHNAYRASSYTIAGLSHISPSLHYKPPFMQ
ncbi:UNVERIFIED_CONTAM: ABC transporter G family member 5 [Sesamum latifolium]|uniref:ABC transporter G family member 5 n=1 Tax=Sesamum latifolium TaxID=2727402 RepID=A0AAW2UIT4_9LAMI